MKLKWLLLGALALVFAVPQASADLNGDCTADINGVSAAAYDANDIDDALMVEEGDTVSYLFASQGQDIATIKITVTIADQKIVLHQDSWDEETQKSVEGTHEFEGLPGGVAGLFLYEGRVTYQDGGGCSGKLLVHVVSDETFTPVVVGGTIVAGGASAAVLGLAAKAAAGSKEALAALKALMGA